MTLKTVRLEYSSICLGESIRRKTVGLTIRQDLLSKAQEYGINLSKLLEKSLMQNLEPQGDGFSFITGFLFPKRKKV